MKRVLWVDDLRPPKDQNFIHILNFNDFVADIKCNGLPDEIWFDHDLGEEKSGYDCAKWLVNYCIDHEAKLPVYHLHTMNPVGRDNILGIFKAFEKYY